MWNGPAVTSSTSSRIEVPEAEARAEGPERGPPIREDVEEVTAGPFQREGTIVTTPRKTLRMTAEFAHAEKDPKHFEAALREFFGAVQTLGYTAVEHCAVY